MTPCGATDGKLLTGCEFGTDGASAGVDSLTSWTQTARRTTAKIVSIQAPPVGSIHAYATSAGRRYRVVYRKPDRKQGQKRGFRTKRDAELYLAEMEVSKARGEFIDAASARVSIDALASPWLASQGHMKHSAYRTVESAWRVHVQPKWGSRSVGSIRHSEVQAWVAEMGRARKATTVIRAYGVLAAMLDVAVKDRRISANPARGVNLPRKVPKRRLYLSHAQVEALAQASGDNATIVNLLAYTGLRWGELTALKVRDADVLRRRLSVVENAVAIGGVVHVGTPKSHQARSVPFPEFLEVPIARLCEGKMPDDLLFEAETGGHLHRPNTSVNTHVLVSQGACGCRPRAHDHPRPSAYGSEPRHQLGGERQGGPAHARPCLRGDDARRLRRPLRRGPRGCVDCPQYGAVRCACCHSVATGWSPGQRHRPTAPESRGS